VRTSIGACHLDRPVDNGGAFHAALAGATRFGLILHLLRIYSQSLASRNEWLPPSRSAAFTHQSMECRTPLAPPAGPFRPLPQKDFSYISALLLTLGRINSSDVSSRRVFHKKVDSCVRDSVVESGAFPGRPNGTATKGMRQEAHNNWLGPVIEIDSGQMREAC
jgi:hypothetical protein